MSIVPLSWLYRHLRKRMEWVSGWLDGYTAMTTGAPAVLFNIIVIFSIIVKQFWWHNDDNQNQNKRSQSFWPNVKHRGKAELAPAKGLDYQQTNSMNCAQNWSGFPTKLASFGIWSGRAARQEGIPRQPAAQSDLLQSSPLASRQPMGGPHGQRKRNRHVCGEIVQAGKQMDKQGHWWVAGKMTKAVLSNWWQLRDRW